MNLCLFRIGFRYTVQNLLQSVLLVLSIALGVAVIVAVDLANESANRSFSLSTESLTGRATHQIAGGSSGLDEDIYRRLRVEAGVKNSAPVVEGYVTVNELDRRPMRLLGVDPFAEAPFRSYVSSLSGAVPLEAITPFLTELNSVLISEDLAESAGLSSGSILTLEYGARTIDAHIVGLLRTSDEISRSALGGILIADISTAQELLNRIGRLSHIDLIIDTDTDAGKDTLERIRRILPQGARIERPEKRSAAIRDMSKAFQLNLFALGLLAVVIGVFLIYNTITFSVVQRRPILGALRALGVTRGQIFGMIIIEAIALAAVGTAIGLLLGTILGQGVVYLVTRTINDLYFTLTVTDFAVSPLSLLKGALIGVSAAVAAAVIPAWEAAYTPPVQTIRRSELESRVMRSVSWITLTGIAVIILGGLSLLPTRSLGVSFGALFAILFGSALIVPAATIALMKLAALAAKMFSNVTLRMAPRGVVRQLSRTAAAVAALMVAVSVIISVDIMIGSFRTTVVRWLESTLAADIFVSVPSSSVSGEGFGAGMKREIGMFPGIRKVETARRVRLNTRKYGPINLVAVTEDIAKDRRFVRVEGDEEDVWNKFRKGAVLISEPFANRIRIRESPDAAITLETDKGLRSFPLAGVYYDYASQTGTVLMSDSVYRSFWDDKQISSVAAYVEHGREVDSVIQGIRAGFAGRRNLIVQSNKSLRLSALAVFDRTFTVTGALRLLAAAVAFIGVFSALMALQLERAGEIGTLRAVGMTVSQIRRMILVETGLMGITAGVIAIPVGTVLALILVYVINLRSFGWTLEFIIRPEYFLEALAVSIAAAILAGIYPAIRFGRMQVADAVRTE